MLPAREVAIGPANGTVSSCTLAAYLPCDDGGLLIRNELLDDWKEPGRNPDGANFDRAGADLPRRGSIGLRCDRGSIAFRNILIEGLLP